MQQLRKKYMQNIFSTYLPNQNIQYRVGVQQTIFKDGPISAVIYFILFYFMYLFTLI